MIAEKHKLFFSFLFAARDEVAHAMQLQVC